MTQDLFHSSRLSRPSRLMDPLALLSRPDKWYLGAGDGLVWAPPFPVWHHTPGFWDDAHLVQYPFGPLFTVSFVGPDGNAIPARAVRTSWTPAELSLHYRLARTLRAVEVRSAPGDLTLASEWEITNSGGRRILLHLVMWTVVDGELVDEVERRGRDLALGRRLRDRKDQQVRVRLCYGLDPGVTSFAACRSERSGPLPDFALSPFYDRWPGRGGLQGELRLEGIDTGGLVYLGLHRKLALAPGGTTRLTARVSVLEVGSAAGPASGIRPRNRAVAGPALRRRARSAWREFLAHCPSFRSSDPSFQRYWYYRWYGLRLNGVRAGLGQYRHDTVCEGIGYFHQPISYSAMAHVRELAWRHDAGWARGVVHTFFDRLQDDGSLPGRVYLDHLVQPDFYHADWGGALDDLDQVHPDPAWLQALFPKLARYGEWLVGSRDPRGSGMIDVTDQYETGQEYMSRYQAVDPDADRYGWENRIRLQGVDVTVYAYRLYQLLARLAPHVALRESWTRRATRTREALRERMWDPDQEMFFDVDPRDGQRTFVKAAVCFYPYLTDVVERRHLEGLGRHLFNPGEFWTPFPVPSSSVDDPRFNPDAEWKGKRHACPWNGRVWPMTNSHIIEALARVVRLFRPDWAPQLVHLVRRFLRMLSFDGDPARPNCFEHYHPMTGRPSRYRGIDDYQHSWVNALLARHVAGLLPLGQLGLMVDPLPFGIAVALTNVRLAGHRVDLTLRDGRFQVRVDGRAAASGQVGRPVEVRW